MALITFLSDFGEKDHYVAAIKAAIFSARPEQQIVDISHKIARHDISHGAFVLKSVFRDFPENSVHLVAVDPVIRGQNRLVALRLENHYFIGHDSGIYSLISSELPEEMVEIPHEESAFVTRDVLVPAALSLSNGHELSSLGETVNDLVIKTDRQVKATKREIVGQIVQIDHYGNLITNIRKSDFDNICRILGGNPGYSIRFARELFDQLNTKYSEVDDGDCFVLFNTQGLLEIGINKGKANELLGLREDAPVIIEFVS